MREPVDAMLNPRVRRMNWVMCPQSGKTKALELGVSALLFYRPTNVLYIRPTEPDIVEGFRDRWRSVIEHNLPEQVPMSGEWVVLSSNPRIELRDSIVYGAAATVARHMTSRSTPAVIYDETDTGGDTGNSLGNALDVAEDRQMAASELQALTMGASSAKFDTGSNWLAYDQRSDRRELWEPCPECGIYQVLPAEPGEFERRFVTVGDERDPEAILGDRLARFVCRGCGSLIEDRWQGWMSSRGVWVPAGGRIEERLPLEDEEVREVRSVAHLPAVGSAGAEGLGHPGRWEPEVVGTGRDNPHRGYRVWAANLNPDGLSPQRSWSHMLARWFGVMRQKDPERIQVMVNSWKSLPFKESLKGMDEEAVRRRVGVHEPGWVPAGGKVMLAAVDVQGAGYLKYDVWVFGVERGGAAAIWAIKHGVREVLHERYREAIEALHAELARGFPIKGEERGGAGLNGEGRRWRMRPYLTLVDSGFSASEVYEACRGAGMLAVKGTERADYTVRLAEVEGKLRAVPVELLWVNNLTVKGRLHRLLQAPADEAGGLWLHAESGEGYIAELAAMELRRRTKHAKHASWMKKSEGRPDDWHDTATYILAGAEALEQKGEVSVSGLGLDSARRGVFLTPAAAGGAAAVGAGPGGRGPGSGPGWGGAVRGRRRGGRVEGMGEVEGGL